MIPLSIFGTFLTIDIAGEYFLKKQSSKQAPPIPIEKPLTPEQIEINELKSELLRMQQEAAQFNTTDTFAKYSKLQRQMIPKQQKLSQLEEQFEKSKEQTQQIEAEVKPTEKQVDPRQKCMLIQVAILVIVIMFVKGSYFTLRSVQYDQLYPINYLIALPGEDENSVQISLSFWCVQCFNFMRISKKMLGIAV